MMYLFILVIAIFFSNFNLSVVNHFSELSLLTVQLSASNFNPGFTGSSGLSLEDQYMLCLDGIEVLREAISDVTSDYENCKKEVNDLQRNYDLQSGVCASMLDDYNRYCKGKKFKSPFFDSAMCRQLKENYKSCLSTKHSLGQQLNDKMAECSQKQSKIGDATGIYEEASKKCSNLERRLYDSRVQTEVRVVEGDYVLDKPLCKVTRGDKDELLDLIKALTRDLEQCLSEVSALTQRRSEINLKKSDLEKQVSDATAGPVRPARPVRTGLKAIFTKKTKPKDPKPKVDVQGFMKQLSELDKEDLGSKKLQLQLENRCRQLSSELDKAKERYNYSLGHPPETPGETRPRTVLQNIGGFFTRCYQRVTGQLRGNNGRGNSGRPRTRF